ncbi:hypothetical protein H5410_052060 [Solanum commersonii]|uniref:Uncharacterized protein n=1 Tax=Solanum commersonii TaxID=4109 RepID=A0A9J5WZU0_SOLCO|nr:hypothetical protein H5410_052060 [Solanum commersonii]
MVCIRIGVRFHLTPKGRCSMNLSNFYYEILCMGLEHEDDVQVNFKLKASKLLSSTFCDCRRKQNARVYVSDRWALLMKHWRS